MSHLLTLPQSLLSWKIHGVLQDSDSSFPILPPKLHPVVNNALQRASTGGACGHMIGAFVRQSAILTMCLLSWPRSVANVTSGTYGQFLIRLGWYVHRPACFGSWTERVSCHHLIEVITGARGGWRKADGAGPAQVRGSARI